MAKLELTKSVMDAVAVENFKMLKVPAWTEPNVPLGFRRS